MHYRVRRGDTLDSIASRYSVSTAELQRWNHLRTERAPRGRVLRIYEEYYPMATTVSERSATAAPGRRSTTGTTSATVKTAAHSGDIIHRVQAGETLWSIARGYQTTVEAIRAGNHYLFSRPLQVGDTLTILPTH